MQWNKKIMVCLIMKVFSVTMAIFRNEISISSMKVISKYY